MEGSEQVQDLAVTTKKTFLLEKMADQYQLDAGSFRSVLLKTVFPQDKQVSMEQLAMFCIVAHKYSLNPLTREVYAFPSKGGGIVPVVGYDGWVSLVQRQEDYDGCEYEYIWQDNKVGGQCLAVTCIIYRRKHSRPTKKTVWMAECRRETEQWKIKPIWMLELKGFIQASRLAYGFGGLYDEDEAQRILEAEAQKTAPAAAIVMPQRLESTPESEPKPTYYVAADVAPKTEEDFSGVDVLKIDSAPLPEPPQKNEAVRNSDNIIDLFGGDPKPANPQQQEEKIGKGKAQRLYTVLNIHKVHSEDDLREEILKPLRIDHLSELPVTLYGKVCDWAEGKITGVK